MKLHEKLSHLGEEEVNRLIERYYAGESINILKQEFNLNIHNNLISILPTKVHESLFCIYCDNVNLVSKYSSRSSWSGGKILTGKTFCPTCYHQDREEYCSCGNCRKQKERIALQEEKYKRYIIEKTFPNKNIRLPSIKELTLIDAVYLLSLQRHFVSEDLIFVKPFSIKTPNLAPTYDFQYHIVNHLYSKRFIAINPSSTTNSFIFRKDLTGIEGYIPNKVSWELFPRKNIGEKIDYLYQLEQVIINKEWPEAWSYDISPLWQNIAKHECIEYYTYMLSQRGYKFDSIGENTHFVFTNLLENFSVAQIFNLSWQAVRDIVDFNIANGIPPYRGKNNFIGEIQRKADKALANSWKVNESRRNFNCPQSVLSSTFFNVFLGLGAEADNIKISVYNTLPT